MNLIKELSLKVNESVLVAKSYQFTQNVALNHQSTWMFEYEGEEIFVTAKTEIKFDVVEVK